MMNIAVFGGSGITGHKFVELALEKGHLLQLLLRDPYKLRPDLRAHQNSKFLQGDVKDKGSVAKTIESADAVVSLLGHGKNTDWGMQTQAMENITEILKNSTNKRLVSLTGIAVVTPDDNLNLIETLFNNIFAKLSKKRVIDGIEHAKVLEQNRDIDWTVVRVLFLSRLFSGSYTVESPANSRFHLPISPQKVAEFMLDIVENENYIHEYPLVSS